MRGHLAAVALVVAAPAPRAAQAQEPSTYRVGSIPVAPLLLAFEAPLHAGIAGELSLAGVAQGTYGNADPFAYLSSVSPSAAIHVDAIRNLRLTAGVQEVWLRAVSPVGYARAREERIFARGRLQHPRGASALYEMLQLMVRRFTDPAGNQHVVLRPSLRFGEGVNLDARHVHSVTLFQEVAFRFSDASYTTHAFELYRAFIGYTWTTSRGVFVTLGVMGELAVTPPATQLNFSYGPVVAVKYRILPAGAKASEAPPEPDAIDLR